MNVFVKLAIAIASLALLTSCYERKVVKLDYTEKVKTGYYTPNGLPGEAHVGRTEMEDKTAGYEHGTAAEGHKAVEKKPEEAKPEEKKPEAAE